jgi:hypothetical protein
MVYDQPTEIVDVDGKYLEVVRRGAAASTIAQERRPPYDRDHGKHPALGRTPLAKLDYLGEGPAARGLRRGRFRAS